MSHETGEPLPFSVISAPAVGADFFTSGSGTFAFSNLPVGPLHIQVRRLGYTPADITVNITAGAPQDIRVRLQRVALTLRTVTVKARPVCKDPGPPRAIDTTLVTVFEQLRANAEQFRLLTESYPFVYKVNVENSSLPRATQAVVVDRTSEEIINSKGAVNYKPGNILERRGRDWYFIIPTLLQFADPKFVNAHCFHFAGTEAIEDSSFIRVDVIAADKLKTPDVDGAIYIDPQTFQVRRTVLSLSKQPRQFPDLQSMEISTDFREVMPTISVIGHVIGTQVIKPEAHSHLSEMYETQELIGVTFLKTIPGKDALTRGKPDK